MDQVNYNFLLVIMVPLKQPVPLNFFKVPKMIFLWEGQPTVITYLADPASNFQLSFDDKSVSDYAQFYMDSDFSPLNAFTLCLWMKPASQLDSSCVFSYSLQDEQNGILICDYVESLMFVIYGYIWGNSYFAIIYHLLARSIRQLDNWGAL